jgi:hypothetical protein
MESCPKSECPNDSYDAEGSSSFIGGQIGTELKYDQGNVIGKWDKDQVCLGNRQSTCTSSSFEFLGATSTSGMIGLKASGLCGMRPYQDNSSDY